MAKFRISVVVDNESWILPYAENFAAWCRGEGHDVRFCRKHDEIEAGDMAFYLGCVKITPPDILRKNTYNLVVHESDLPKGRGFAPVAWQILEGKSEIPICLIEAADDVDSGVIYDRTVMKLDGTELCPEWRGKQGESSVQLCRNFVQNFPNNAGREQLGEPSYYERRRPEDSQLDISKTIEAQFDLLRVVDNERYPAWFEYRGQRYVVKIEKSDDGLDQ